MLDNPIGQAQEKLQHAINAAKALTSIEKELGTDPSIIEEKTEQLKGQLSSEMKNVDELASQQNDPLKRSKYNKMKKTAKEDMSEAQSILSLIVRLEAAKYFAKERARQKLKQAERNHISTAPSVPMMSPVSPESAMPHLAQNPPYYPMFPSYISPYQSPSYPQYPGSYPAPSPFGGQSSWMSPEGLGMNQGMT